MNDRIHPDEPAGPFPIPPFTFTDEAGRTIEIRAFERGETEDASEGADLAALVEMYTAFDPKDRAQGIPPSGESALRDWLDIILDDDGYNVVAWDGDTAAGHATLVADGDAYELAIFVLQTYQGAGIGTRLIEGLLGYGAAHGVEKVWLTVERWNRPAVALYKNVGFETSDAESFELEMTALLESGETN